MEIALLGGTGDIGEGLALRWARDTDHDVVVGSRDADRARERVAEYEGALAERGESGSLRGASNADAAAAGEVVVLAVPPYYVRSVVTDLGDALAESVVVNPAVGIERSDAGFEYNRPSAGSVTELVARAAPDRSRVVGAYHNLPAARLSDLDSPLGIDTVLVGEGEAKATVATLTEEIEGLGVVDGGPLANAAMAEELTALLMTLKRYNEDMGDVGVRFD